MKYFLLLLFLNAFHVCAQTINVIDFGIIPNSFNDATAGLKKAIEASRDQDQTIINFPKGRYDFWPDEATETSYYISNTSSEQEVPVKRQRVGLYLKELRNITIEGNGALFVFHGKMISWVLDGCENVRIQNLSVDYERPGMSEMTINTASDQQVVVDVHPDSKFYINDGRLEWYEEKWIARNHHAVLVKPRDGVSTYSSWAPFENSKAERLGPLRVRFLGDFSKFKASPGDVLTIRDRYRDYVGAFINRSKHVRLYNLHMNSMHGLGIVSQFSENLNYEQVYIEPAEGSGRVISSSADGMHFSGCKGQILITDCRFKGMHDDAINVHGTHLKVTAIVSPTKLKLKFMHPQTYGFEAFIAGDSVAFLHSASLQIFGQGLVTKAKLISPYEMEVEFTKPVSSALKVDDALENISWTPAVTIRNCRFEGTNTRGNLITTRRKVVIENNVYFRTGMHAILIENDAEGWYESGPVNNVMIRNNEFIECGYNSAPDNYVIKVNPQTNKPNRRYFVHHNIQIEGNRFKVYDLLLLSARSTSTLGFKNNKVEFSEFLPAVAAKPSFHLDACEKVDISGNAFYKAARPIIETVGMLKSDVRSDLTLQQKD